MAALKYIVLLSACAAVALAYSTGAPKEACGDLTPQHHTAPQTSAAPYTLSSSAAQVGGGQSVTVTLAGNGADDKLQGFLIQARDGQTTLGSFKVIDKQNSQTLACVGNADTITHKKLNPNGISQVQFVWVAPKDFKGRVQFVGTALKNGGVFWSNMQSQSVNVV